MASAAASKPRVSVSGSVTNFFSGKKNVKKEREPTTEEKMLQTKTDKEKVKKEEKERVTDFRKKQEAASTIQRAWRKHRKTRQQEKIFADSAQKAVRLRRVQASQAEWHRQIAALTIQLAWRKYYRRKLMTSLSPNRQQLQMWDPQIVALKQQALIGQIYGEELMAPFWHPTLKPAVRPFWLHLVPSAAAVSYNFAVDQYHPHKSWQGVQPHNWDSSLENSLPFDFGPYASSSMRPFRAQTTLFSLNVKKV